MSHILIFKRHDFRILEHGIGNGLSMRTVEPVNLSTLTSTLSQIFFAIFALTLQQIFFRSLGAVAAERASALGPLWRLGPKAVSAITYKKPLVCSRKKTHKQVIFLAFAPTKWEDPRSALNIVV